MLRYARADTHFLLFIYDHLRNALLQHSKEESNPQQAMRETLNLCAGTALRLYERTIYDEVTGKGLSGWGNAIKKWLPASTTAGTVLAFRRLHRWRDRAAREEDEAPGYAPNLLEPKINGSPDSWCRPMCYGT